MKVLSVTLTIAALFCANGAFGASVSTKANEVLGKDSNNQKEKANLHRKLDGATNSPKAKDILGGGDAAAKVAENKKRKEAAAKKVADLESARKAAELDVAKKDAELAAARLDSAKIDQEIAAAA